MSRPFWTDEPLEQWIAMEHDPLHLAPWAVVIAGYVRARYYLEADAAALVVRIRNAFTTTEETR